MSSNLSIIDTLSITLTDDELSDAINILVRSRKERQANQMLEMKNILVKGDLVEFYHSGQKQYIRGTIKRTKTKKALVAEEKSMMTWDVPMGMLRKC